MIKRPTFTDLYSLRNRFTGTIEIDGWSVWLSSGNFIDFMGGRNGRHRHSYYEVCLVLGGQGYFVHDDIKTQLQKGDLFVADPGVLHEIISDKRSTLKIQFIAFSLKNNENGKGSPSTSIHNRYLAAFLEDHALITHNCGILADLFRYLKTGSLEIDKARWHIKNESILRSIFLEILLLSVNHIENVKDSFSMDSRFQMALRFIRDNADRKLSVDEIARQAAVSPRTLRRQMKKYCNMTVIQKCFEVRIEEAARFLVTNPDISVSEVSYLYGFENPSDFCRGFKKQKKISPGKFRENRGTTFS